MINKLICNRYKVIDHLGTGGMATVWLAEDTILNRKVAVKTFKIDSSDQDAIKRFNREANAVTSLSHENIVSIYGVENEDNFYYLILEYVEGQTLKEYLIKNKEIPLETIIHIGKQISLGLQHAHENGIIHRDIKPQNILLSNNLDCKITDFGISRAYGDTTLTQTNQMLGTVYYLSPEQARGNLATSQSDIYSLGIILFELLTGKIPFNGESAVSIALKHLQENLPDIDSYRPNIPQSFKNVIIKATMKNPNERYINSKELYNDLQTCLNLERINENKYEGFSPIDKINYTQKQSKEIVENKNIKENISTSKKPVVLKNVREEKSKKKQSYFGKIILAVLLSIGAIASTVYAYTYYIDSSKVTVPDVENMPFEQAERKLVSLGFKVESVEVESETVSKNIVISSYPTSGKKIDKGSIINLKVSSGKKSTIMSNYIGLNKNQVKDSIEKLGLKNVIFEEEDHDKIPEGIVFYQSINSGSNIIASETNLIIKVSKGRKNIELINLVGKSLDEAKILANNLGFNIVVSSSEYNEKFAENLIITQIPAATSIIKKGDTVAVIISKGKDPKRIENTIKDFISKNISDLENWAQNSGFKIKKQLVESDEKEGTIIKQSPIRGNAEQGSTISVLVAGKKESTTTTEMSQKNT